MRYTTLASIALVGSCMVLASCGDIARENRTYALARPTDACMIRWLEGQEFDFDALRESPVPSWAVKKGEVSRLQIKSVSQAPEGVLSAVISFDARAGDRGVQITGILRYRQMGEYKLQYVDFGPARVRKIGDW